MYINLKFKVDYTVRIDIDLLGYTKKEFMALNKYARDNIILDWRSEWIGEDIYDVGVIDAK